MKPQENDRPSIELIERARGVVSRHTRRTPLLHSERLSAIAGGDVFLKCENLQVTGSFKVRGAFAHVGLHRPAAVVASSAGNHGQGLALAARTYAIPCTIVVPRGIPLIKEEAIRGYGARVIPSPFDGYDDTQEWTLEHLAEFGGTFVSPFEDPAVIAGNGGTTALEILEDMPDIDTIIVPCGGGGCVVGVGIAARGRARVIGVNTDASPGMWLSRRDGHAHLRIESRPTIAEGIEGGVGERTYRWACEVVDDIVLTKEETIRRAVVDVARYERMVVEGSGAAGVAALLDGAARGKRVCVILTGANIDRERFVELVSALR